MRVHSHLCRYTYREATHKQRKKERERESEDDKGREMEEERQGYGAMEVHPQHGMTLYKELDFSEMSDVVLPSMPPVLL
eukprot:9498366-Pyramimonas_sp.AAC.2